MKPPALKRDSWIRRDAGRVFTRLGDEVVLLDLENDVYLKLNEVAARIWDLLEQPRQVQELLAILLEEYRVEPAQLEQDLYRFLQEMLQRGLVHVVKAP